MLTFLYFFILLVLFPFIGFIEKHIYYTYVYRFYKNNKLVNNNNNLIREKSFLGKIINIFIVYFIYKGVNIFYKIIALIYNFIKSTYLRFRKK
jgi:hypothetical protein